MKTKFTAEVLALAGIVASLAVTSGCRTAYSNNDLSLTPSLPNSLAPEAQGDVKYPTEKTEPPKEYWQTHPQELAALDRPVSNTKTTQKLASTSFSRYTVKNGDSLSKIAAAHGLRTADVLAMNPGIDSNKIKVGQVIYLPATGKGVNASGKSSGLATPTSYATSAGGTYTVKKGDILGRIAKANGVKIADLKKANNLTSDTIKIGQKLVIPGKAAAKTTTAGVSKKENTGAATKSASDSNKSSEKTTTPTPVSQDSTTVTTPPAVEPPAPSVEVPVVPVPEVTTPDVTTPDVIAPAVPKAVETPVSAEPKGMPYVVEEGQDLYDISVKWSVPITEIKTLNKMTSDEVTPGQTLYIPTHTAQ